MPPSVVKVIIAKLVLSLLTRSKHKGGKEERRKNRLIKIIDAIQPFILKGEK